uniref:Integrase, catalytic region, zinc finger, CCHC-type, peptidase aspartic, catalytic n=1 Tax=Tanacetum cinerariifolium TaxID=118510 RepID=A0A699J737_TANCI|nr:integrase, catalytic region, zinc finger, CCHC-type, peptidase aspartic, catalytic [Tanacetum cinerariifolium]
MITPTGLTDGEQSFEQTKACYLQEVIPFFKKLKDNFEGIQKALTKEVKEIKDVFEELEDEVAQYVVYRKHDAIERKNLLIANDNLIAACLSQEVFFVATNSELNVARFTEMHVAYTARCLDLKAELANLRDTNNHDNQKELINHFFKLEGKDNVIHQLKKQLSQLQVTRSDTNRTLRVQTTDSQITNNATVNPQVSARYKHAIDVEPSVPRLRNNRDAHLDYLRHLKESVETIYDIVEEAKVKTNVPVPPTTGENSCPNASESQPKSHVKSNRISPAKGVNKLPVEDQPRTNKSHLRTSNRVDSSSHLKRTIINLNADSMCQTCNKCLTFSNHDMCVATCLQSVMATPSIRHNYSVERKAKQVWKPNQVRQVWKPTSKVLTTIGHQWRPTCWIFNFENHCPLTRFTPLKVVSAKPNKKRASTCANQKEPNQNLGI